MRTVHSLDFIRVKTALAASVDRDPLKRPKDKLQAQVAQMLRDDSLSHRSGEAASALWLPIALRLRHVQGGGSGDGDWRGAADGEAGGKSGHFVAT